MKMHRGPWHKKHGHFQEVNEGHCEWNPESQTKELYQRRLEKRQRTDFAYFFVNSAKDLAIILRSLGSH